MILFPMEWLEESSFHKNLIVMISLKGKLNCKQLEPSQPSRTLNYVDIFQQSALREWGEY